MSDWLHIHRGDAPLIVSMPHTGAALTPEVEPHLVSPWRARKDADWHIEKLYDFAAALGATTLRTALSRTIIDVNRDPSGASLYPGQATTGLCPTITFDDEPLYRDGAAPNETEIARRRDLYFAPYHAVLISEIARLRAKHERIVVYDAHSIRSRAPMLFEGELPQFNIGTNSGASCDPVLSAAIAARCAASGLTHVVNGRFKGGYITRRYGEPSRGVNGVQMELALRGYLDEPAQASEQNWPPPFDPARAAPMQGVLRAILQDCIAFGEGRLP